MCLRVGFIIVVGIGIRHCTLLKTSQGDFARRTAPCPNYYRHITRAFLLILLQLLAGFIQKTPNYWNYLLLHVGSPISCMVCTRSIGRHPSSFSIRNKCNQACQNIVLPLSTDTMGQQLNHNVVHQEIVVGNECLPTMRLTYSKHYTVLNHSYLINVIIEHKLD